MEEKVLITENYCSNNKGTINTTLAEKGQGERNTENHKLLQVSLENCYSSSPLVM